MEKIFEQPQTIQFFEKLLSIDTTDIDLNDFKNKNHFVFAVTPEYKILLSKKSHEHLFEKYGVDLDRTLTEGYLNVYDKMDEKDRDYLRGLFTTYENDKVIITFKSSMYQLTPGFKGTPEELSNLKFAIRNKIFDFLVKNNFS